MNRAPWRAVCCCLGNTGLDSSSTQVALQGPPKGAKGDRAAAAAAMDTVHTMWITSESCKLWHGGWAKLLRHKINKNWYTHVQTHEAVQTDTRGHVAELWDMGRFSMVWTWTNKKILFQRKVSSGTTMIHIEVYPAEWCSVLWKTHSHK